MSVVQSTVKSYIFGYGRMGGESIDTSKKGNKPQNLNWHVFIYGRGETRACPHWLPGDKYQWLWPQAWSEISTCWQLSSLPLQGQGTHLPRGPCDLPSENFVKCVICKTFFFGGIQGNHIVQTAYWIKGMLTTNRVFLLRVHRQNTIKSSTCP